MTPRERAEALGWRRADDGVWSRSSTRHVFSTSYSPYPVGPTRDGTWGVGWCARWVPECRYATEDEALEHALLLRDAWLS